MKQLQLSRRKSRGRRKGELAKPPNTIHDCFTISPEVLENTGPTTSTSKKKFYFKKTKYIPNIQKYT